MKSCSEVKKSHIQSIEVQNSLKEEILQLQKQLDEQVVVRCALQKVSRYTPRFQEPINANSITKCQIQPAEDLIKEIATLEMEVVNLEKYLLAMYRKTFDKTSISLPTKGELLKPNADSTQGHRSSEILGHAPRSTQRSPVINSTMFSLRKEPTNECKPLKESSNNVESNGLLDSSIHLTHSSLSQTAACSFRVSSPPRGTVSEALYSYHSLPLSMLERGENATSSVSLAEHLANNMIVDNVRETPNRLSEELVKCISAIYCQLAEPPLFNQGFLSSPVSFSSSTSGSPSRGLRDTQVREHSLYNSWFNNPFHVEDSKELSGSFSAMIEIQGICRDDCNLKGVEDLLKNFRSLVSRLEEVDPRKMKHEEKLAFWINVHNVLVMHAFLVYGIPQSNLKRTSLLLKAAYNIGGHTVSVDMIQSSILGCRLTRPGQWLQSLFFPKSKFKARDAGQSYAIGRPQPLVQFALSSGSYSDPMVRIYTPKRLFQELEMAKEEYIQTTCRVQKQHKILVPKIVESYAKEINLSSTSLLEMIDPCTPNSMQKSFLWTHREKIPKKIIEWTPHNFTFRYLLSPELVK